MWQEKLKKGAKLFGGAILDSIASDLSQTSKNKAFTDEQREACRSLSQKIRDYRDDD